MSHRRQKVATQILQQSKSPQTLQLLKNTRLLPIELIGMIHASMQSFILRSTERFQIEAQISCGGSGAVWLAYDKLLCSAVAIKSIFGWSSEISRLQAEVLGGRRIQSPYVVQVYDLIQLQRTYCIVMQYIAGTPLSKFLKNIVLAGDAKRFIVQLCRGVLAIHQAGFAHRDLTASNLLITHDGDLAIVDLGSSELLSKEHILGSRQISADISALSLLSANIVEAALKSGANDYWLEPLLEKSRQSCYRKRYATARDFLEDLEMPSIDLILPKSDCKTNSGLGRYSLQPSMLFESLEGKNTILL